ncbi:MAG: hypothetical protein FDX30_07540 [Chlorobium sp.]|nr:MAG: hypothetical protein FDX30_07540 [Chlorobium sp.]
MIKIDKKTLSEMEADHPGIEAQIRSFEEADLPACSQCKSQDTAAVNVGIIPRTMYIAGATTKFKLIPNGPKPGKYFCNTCKRFFDKE